MEREARMMLAGILEPRAVCAYFSCEQDFSPSPTRRFSRAGSNLNC